MPTLSLITAVVAGKHRHIGETYRSLVGQELPVGWDWEWLVQEDGDTGVPFAELPQDPRISFGQGPRGCAAIARTLALGRAEGVLTRAVDADDVLTPGALYRDITAIGEHGAAWVVSAAVDLLPDGIMRPGPRDPAPGPTAPGFFADGVARGQLQVVAGTLCGYTNLIRAVGGWPAVPTQEDIQLLLAVEAVSSGCVAENVSLLYRRWPGSTTFGIDKSGMHYGDPAIAVSNIRRMEALRECHWRWSGPPALQGSPVALAVTDLGDRGTGPKPRPGANRATCL
ncbi:glycosyltransferase family 2 protein [Nocardia alni]|uniref:glycosyltransferase family 2 protein n=1 Tax=Nocardia alni TaxID=2815723 RepID=UPI001C241722|nr:glycosyltransferase family 2 protein [Nocardia alni]